MPRAHNLPFLVVLGDRLKARRDELRWSQAVLARACQLSTNQISRYEMGYSDPPVTVLRRICRALDVPLGVMVEEPK